MNDTLTLPQGLPMTLETREVLPFPASISERSAKQLSLSAGELMRNISSIVDDLVVSALEKQTAAEFKAFRDAVFPNYFGALQAFSNLARIVVAPHAIDRIAAESFCEVEADLREHGLRAFGAEVRDQAIFTVWTFRKIWDVGEKIRCTSLSASLKKADTEFANNFGFFVVWARFHLDCLIQSMRLHRPMYPDVLGLVLDGLRAAVNAYAWARRGLELRIPRVELELPPVEWDDEEQQLLDEATNDLLVTETT